MSWLNSASIAAGFGAAFALTQIFPTVQDVRSLKEIGGRPILGSASLVVNPLTSDATRRENRLFFGLIGAFLALNLCWLIAVKQSWLL